MKVVTKQKYEALIQQNEANVQTINEVKALFGEEANNEDFNLKSAIEKLMNKEENSEQVVELKSEVSRLKARVNGLIEKNNTLRKLPAKNSTGAKGSKTEVKNSGIDEFELLTEDEKKMKETAVVATELSNYAKSLRH